MFNHYFPASYSTVETIASQLYRAESQGLSDYTIGKHWIQRFLKRHLALSTAYERALDFSRANAGSNNGKIIAYFETLRKTLVDYEVEPENVYNMDETGFAIGIWTKDRSKVVIPYRTRTAFTRQQGTRS